MKKHPLPILVSCVLILASASAMAAPVEVSVEPDVQTGQLYSASSFSITITNTQDLDDIFQLVYSGEHMEWRMPGLIAKNVPAHSSAVTEVMLYPTGSSRGRFEFSVKDSSGKIHGPVLFRETVSGEKKITKSFAQEKALAGGTATCYLSVS